MLSFTQNLNHIENLTKLTTLAVEAENYLVAIQRLDEIHVYASTAQLQLEEFRRAQAGSKPKDIDTI